MTANPRPLVQEKIIIGRGWKRINTDKIHIQDLYRFKEFERKQGHRTVCETVGGSHTKGKLSQQRRVWSDGVGDKNENEPGEKIWRKEIGGRRNINPEIFDSNSCQLHCPSCVSSESGCSKGRGEKKRRSIRWSWYCWTAGCKSTQKEMNRGRKIPIFLSFPFTFKFPKK